MVRKPAIHLELPAVGQVVFPFQLPCGVSDVLQGRFVYPVGIVVFIKDGVLGQSGLKIVPGPKRLRYAATPINSDGVAIDPSDGPMFVVFFEDIADSRSRNGFIA